MKDSERATIIGLERQSQGIQITVVLSFSSLLLQFFSSALEHDLHHHLLPSFSRNFTLTTRIVVVRALLHTVVGALVHLVILALVHISAADNFLLPTSTDWGTINAYKHYL